MRCFVALWPDAAARARIDAIGSGLHARLGAGRRIPAANLHATLAFIGELDAGRAAALAGQLLQIAHTPFDWHVDRVGQFGRARVVWVGSVADERLAALARDVRRMLDRLRVPYDPKPFAPHVTVLRDVGRGALTLDEPVDPPVTWPVRSPVLLQSDSAGGRVSYRPVA